MVTSQLKSRHLKADRAAGLGQPLIQLSSELLRSLFFPATSHRFLNYARHY